MGVDLAAARAAVDALAVGLLLTALVSVLVRRLDHAILLLALQGGLLAGAAAVAAALHGEWHGAGGALATLLVKAVAIPAALAVASRGVRVRAEAQAVLTRKQAFPVALALVLVAYYVAAPLATPDGLATRNALPAAVALLLLGLFNMVTRRKAAAQVAALVTLENGLYLAAVAATGGLPLAVELGIALDLLVGVVVMGAVFRQIYRTFDSTDTDRLRALRG